MSREEAQEKGIRIWVGRKHKLRPFLLRQFKCKRKCLWIFRVRVRNRREISVRLLLFRHPNMADKVAEEYGIKLVEVLTGFKYIGEQIKLFEQTGHGTYEFGFEESYGCLVGTHARDKDAVVAVMMLCEAAAYYMKQGLTLWDQMLKIYDKYGFFKESLQTLTLKGISCLSRQCKT